MLKVKKTIYGSLPKNNELAKLTTEIEQAIQKIEEKNKKKQNKQTKKTKTINDYVKLIQSIKKEYQKLALENEILKTKVKKLDAAHY